jgi:hypothetical protein
MPSPEIVLATIGTRDRNRDGISSSDGYTRTALIASSRRWRRAGLVAQADDGIGQANSIVTSSRSVSSGSPPEPRTTS